MTLISAPAGFGKTTLISQWRMRIPDVDDPQAVCQNPKFGWLSLEEGDNDPLQFLGYLLAALRKIIPGVADSAVDLLRSPQPPPMETVLTPVVNEIAVAAEHRGQGIGRSLMDKIHHWARAQGIAEIELQVWERNDQAIGFDENLGYEKWRRTMRLNIDKDDWF